MINVYSDTPWLIPKDPACLIGLFRRLGHPVAFKARESVNFGIEQKAYLVEKGLIATFADGLGQSDRLMAIFGPGSVFGAEKSLKGAFSTKPLIARALIQVEGFALDAAQFKRELEADQALCLQALHAFIRHDDAKIEGLLVNGLAPVPERLARVIEVIFAATGQQLDDFPRCLPRPVSVTELARMTHSDRAVVSRILSAWERRGLIEKTAGVYRYSRRLLQAAGSGELEARQPHPGEALK